MTALKGKVAVVTGATGIVGSGVVRRLLQEGCTVVAPIRLETSKENLITEIDDVTVHEGQLHTPVCEYNLPEGIAILEAYIKESFPGGIDVVLSSFGGDVPVVPLSQITVEGMDQIKHRAQPHVLLANGLVPLMKQSTASSYTIITGSLGENCFEPRFAAFTIANAAIYGIFQALISEQSASPVRFNELRIRAMLRKHSKEGHPFVSGGRAFSSVLIGDEIVELAQNERRNEIIRIMPDYLEAKVAQ